MRRMSRRAVLRGAAAVPVSAHLVAADMKLRMAGLKAGFTGSSPEVAGSAYHLFHDFAKWFTKVGEREIREQAKHVTMLDPDIVEMQSPSLSYKIKMQEKRNYARILAEREDWFAKQLSLSGVVKVWR